MFPIMQQVAARHLSGYLRFFKEKGFRIWILVRFVCTYKGSHPLVNTPHLGLPDVGLFADMFNQNGSPHFSIYKVRPSFQLHFTAPA